jgi:hypothetical protein
MMTFLMLQELLLSYVGMMHHGRCDPVKLPFSRDHESGKQLQLGVQFHLPESRGEVKGGQNLRVDTTDVPDAFGDLLHWILVNMGILV